MVLEVGNDNVKNMKRLFCCFIFSVTNS